MTIKTKVNLIQSSTFEVGLATNTDGYIYFDNGQSVKSGFRLNSETSKVEYSNDGYSWLYFITQDVGGDISGSSYNANVNAINNYSLDLSYLSDGYVLYYNSSNKWTLSKISGDISGSLTNVIVNKINGIEINTTSPINNSTYVYDLATNKWIPEIIVTTTPVSDYTTGGDSSGDITNMRIIGFNGYPLETTQTPIDGQVRYYNASHGKWWCSNIGGDLSGSYVDVNVDALNGIEINSIAPTDNQALIYNQEANQWIPETMTITGTSVDISSVGGRLTLESGIPYMTNDVGYEDKTILYWTPINGGKIALYDGYIWNSFSPGEISISTSGLDGYKNYDVFMRFSSGVCSLVFGPAWTDDFTRTVELSKQDGVYIQASTNYRYLGTIRTSIDLNISYDIVKYSPFATLPTTPFNGLIYDSYHNRIYYLPGEDQAIQDQWYYLDCSTNKYYMYNNNLSNKPVSGGYAGAAYDSFNHRIYLAPYKQAIQDYWHYIDCDTNTVIAYSNTVKAEIDYGIAAFSGAGFDSINNRIYFSPNSGNETKLFYIECDTNTIVSFDNTEKTIMVSSNAYSGASFDFINSRIYFSPYRQADQTKWHYIDTSTNTIVAYNNMVGSDKSITYGYSGITFDSAHNRMYLAPYFQGAQPKWHYIDTSTNTVIAYTNNSTLNTYYYAYIGATFDSDNNRVYFAPYYQSDRGTGSNQAYHYVDTNTNNVYYYISDTYATASSYAFSGAEFCSTNNRIYFGPLKLTAPWYYVSTSDNIAYTYNLPSGYLDANSRGGVLNTTNNTIYYTPAGMTWRSSGTTFYYLDCNTNILNVMNAAIAYREDVWYPYSGCAAFDPIHNRVYFAPYEQAAQDYWHYIDCDTNTVVEYLNTVSNRPIKYAYEGAVFDPVNSRVYLIPYKQANQTYWHYIDTDTNTVIPYAHGLSVGQTVEFAYKNGVFENYSNRIYFSPFAQAIQGTWHYIDCNNGNIIPYSVSALNDPTDQYTNNKIYYEGATFDSVNNRIYLTPSYNYDSGAYFWHYIDITNNIVKYYSNYYYSRTSEISEGNGAFIASKNRIYFPPSSDIGNSTYIDTIDSTLKIYNDFPEVKYFAYGQAIYNSINDRIYFTPDNIAGQSSWSYIQITETEISPVTFNYTLNKLDVWNYYNRKQRQLKIINPTVNFQSTEASAMDCWAPVIDYSTIYFINILIGVKEDIINIICKGRGSNYYIFNNYDSPRLGIGLNSYSHNSATLTSNIIYTTAEGYDIITNNTCIFDNYIQQGYNTIYMLNKLFLNPLASIPPITTLYGPIVLSTKILA